MTYLRLGAAGLAVGLACVGPQVAVADSIGSVQKRLMFRSAVMDAPGCAVEVTGGMARVGGAMAGGGASACPDAFAWAQFSNAIAGEFWTWATDETMWPGHVNEAGTAVVDPPLPLCTASVTENCCTLPPAAGISPPSSAAPPTQCPVFRADYTPIPPLPTQVEASRALVDHRGLAEVDPGRFLRDNELELVFRNRAFFNYVFANDLYSKEGLGARNRAQNAALSGGRIGEAHRWSVRFPIDAVMVKVDMIRDDYMADLGLIADTNRGTDPSFSNDPDYPYVVLQNGERQDEDGNTVPNYFYVVAMTNASKELPIWHWYAIEHVKNLGRCDYIGCNDSFGFTVSGVQGDAAFGSNYTPPMIVTDENAPDALFVTGEAYLPEATGEAMSAALQALFAEMGVGTGATPGDLTTLHVDDPAWMNYRLKGTQTDFTGADGVPTGTGATVTEGGFVNSASCTTCHAQASVDGDGASGLQGVGATWRPNLMGFGQVAMGSPDGSWFYNFGGPSITATQVDFVWGILGAHCRAGPPSGACDSYPDAPTVVTE